MKITLIILCLFFLSSCYVERDLYAKIDLFELKIVESIDRNGNDMWKMVWLNERGIKITTFQVGKPGMKEGDKIPGFLITFSKNL